MQNKKIQLESNLKYRRQFIVTPEPVSCFPEWQQSQFIGNNLFIYAHPDLGLHAVGKEQKNIKIVLLGYIIDPDFPEKTDEILLNEIINKTNSIDDFTKNIINLAGRYVFILNINGRIYFFHDPGGLRSIFYSENEGKKYIATQPLLFGELFKIIKSDNYELYISSKHYKEDTEYWVPSGVTLYDNIHHLVPNHYLDVSTFKQVRYWPVKNLHKLKLEPGTAKAAQYIKNLIKAASLRFKLALPLTAGADSRIFLAASKSLNLDMFYYTLLYSRHNKSSYDISIPRHILKKIKKKHHLINCQGSVEPSFLEFNKKNVDLAHPDWSKNIYGMYNKFPKGFVDLKGNVSEIARCVLFPDGIHPEISSLDQIEMYLKDFREMPFIMRPLEKWFSEAKKISDKTGYEILDLFYWEIRIGSWYAQANNETDFFMETFTPFNFRPLLETMLGVPSTFRQRDHSLMHKKMIAHFDPELLYWPINLRWHKRDQIKYYIAYKLKRLGLFNIANPIYLVIHKSYLKLKSILLSR